MRTRQREQRSGYERNQPQMNYTQQIQQHHHATPPTLFHRHAFLFPLTLLLLLYLPHRTDGNPLVLTSVRVQPLPPDFSRPPVLVALLMALVFLPSFTITSCLIIKRRNFYPIAGRGSWLLIIMSFLLVNAVMMHTSLGFTYPEGMPCYVNTVSMLIYTVPIGLIYMIRGIILVFRVEIMNYLAERQWRTEKQKLLGLQAEEHGIGISEEDDDAEKGLDEQQQDSDGTQENNEDPKKMHDQLGMSSSRRSRVVLVTPPIPGEWFITHRKYIDSRLLILLSSLTVSSFLIGMPIIISFDPTIDTTNELLVAGGSLQANETYLDQEKFGSLNFWNGPQCHPIHSIRRSGEVFCVFLVFPVIIWCGWRILIDHRRREKRMQEKLALEGVLLANATPLVSDLDDTIEVRNEFKNGILITLLSQAIAYPIQLLVPSWSELILYTTTLTFWYITLVTPLRISYNLSKRIRETIGMKALERTGGHRRLQTEGEIIPQHHLPYYSLNYLLASHYTLLLAFLQKEHSSENILFLAEVQKFTSAAVKLESACDWLTLTQDQSLDQNDQLVKKKMRGRLSISVSNNRHQIVLPPITQNATMAGTQTHRRLATTLVEIPITRSVTLTTSSSPAIPENQSLLTEIDRIYELCCRLQAQYLSRSAVFEVNVPQKLSKMMGRRMAKLMLWRGQIRGLKSRSSPVGSAGNSSKALQTMTLDGTSKLGPLALNTDEAIQFPPPPPFPLSALYCEVYTEIYQLIESDSLRRFVLTSGFKSLLRHSDENEVNRLEQQNDLVAETAKVADRASQQLL